MHLDHIPISIIPTYLKKNFNYYSRNSYPNYLHYFNQIIKLDHSILEYHFYLVIIFSLNVPHLFQFQLIYYKK